MDDAGLLPSVVNHKSLPNRGRLLFMQNCFIRRRYIPIASATPSRGFLFPFFRKKPFFGEHPRPVCVYRRRSQKKCNDWRYPHDENHPFPAAVRVAPARRLREPAARDRRHGKRRRIAFLSGRRSLLTILRQATKYAPKTRSATVSWTSFGASRRKLPPRCWTAAKMPAIPRPACISPCR